MWMITHPYTQIPVPVRACASTRTDPNTRTSMSITGNGNLRILVPTYTSCKADPDLWLKAVTRPEDNVRYYAYIQCYVDDILCIHQDPTSAMNEINGYLPMKPSSVGDPDIYLGAKLKQTQIPNGVMAWGLSP
jgi:hypothetical protein